MSPDTITILEEIKEVQSLRRANWIMGHEPISAATEELHQAWLADLQKQLSENDKDLARRALDSE